MYLGMDNDLLHLLAILWCNLANTTNTVQYKIALKIAINDKTNATKNMKFFAATP